MRNDVIFAVETTLMTINILLSVGILLYLAWNRSRTTTVSLDDLEKLGRGT